MRKDAAEDKMQAQRSTSQYEVLSRSWKGLEERYEKQTHKLRNDLSCLQQEIESDKNTLSKLEVILEQLAQEGDKSKKAKGKLLADFQAYKVEQEMGIRDIRNKAELNDIRHDRTLEQMQNTLGDMKYVMNIKKHVYPDVNEQE